MIANRLRRLSSAASRPSVVGSLLLAGWLLPCAGCWEEVRYEPSHTANAPPSQHPDPTEQPVTEDEQAAATSEDLFGSDEPVEAADSMPEQPLPSDSFAETEPDLGEIVPGESEPAAPVADAPSPGDTTVDSVDRESTMPDEAETGDDDFWDFLAEEEDDEADPAETNDVASKEDELDDEVVDLPADARSTDNTQLLEDNLLNDSAPADSSDPARNTLPDSVERLPENGTEEESAGSDDDPLFRSSPDTDQSQPAALLPSRDALAVWRMSSKWSLAAAMHAKGLEAERYRDQWEQAEYAARLLGVELPALPSADKADVEREMVRFLLDTGPRAMGEQFEDQGQAETLTALAELAAKSHLLLLSYTPHSERLGPLVDAIRQAASRSGLPANVWADLIRQLEERAPYAEVKQAVYRLHERVAEYLADDAK